MASLGPNSPGTAGSMTLTGSGVNWPTTGTYGVDGIKASGGNSAAIGWDWWDYSNYARASNFGFSIPTGATIDGIVVEASLWLTGTNTVCDKSIKVVKADSSLSTSDLARSSTTYWPSSASYVTFGSSTETWGETWTPANINDSNFGAVISARFLTDNVATAAIDHVRITVYYTASVSGPANLKTVNGLATASVKTINGLAIASVKTWNGLA